MTHPPSGPSTPPPPSGPKDSPPPLPPPTTGDALLAALVAAIRTGKARRA